MKNNLGIFSILIILGFNLSAQTKYDTIYNYISSTAVVIDAKADEECWQNAEWHDIANTWIPYGATVSESDFDGRFKVSWDVEYFYLLVEIRDDSLSDDHSDPLQNWWDDDCVEIFIDENRSLGNHERNNNAFAYHVSIFYDAIDMSTSGSGINYKDHINVVMDTIGDDLYLWEFAIKLYDASYSNSNPEASRVFPEHNKVSGFSLAYCDNDEGTSRENFFGSMTLTSATANNSYIDATIFGVMKFIDPSAVNAKLEKISTLRIFPNPADEYLTIQTGNSDSKTFDLYSLSGKKIRNASFNEENYTLNLESLEPGAYILKLEDKNGIYTKKMMVR